MTLTELRYIVALAQERHFGNAAAKCFVSQPTQSTAILKLEAELGAILFPLAEELILTAPDSPRSLPPTRSSIQR